MRITIYTVQGEEIAALWLLPMPPAVLMGRGSDPVNIQLDEDPPRHAHIRSSDIRMIVCEGEPSYEAVPEAVGQEASAVVPLASKRRASRAPASGKSTP